jgi:hypothetical protein
MRGPIGHPGRLPCSPDGAVTLHGGSIMIPLRLVRLCVAVLLVACTILLSSTGSVAQETKGGDIILPQIGSGSVDAYIEALKSDIRNFTRKIMEVNMQLTEKEAALFWPIYDRYDYDVSKLNFERSSIYDFYADNYKTLSDEQAKDIIRRFYHVDRWRLSLEEKYSREMGKVLPMRTVLRFLQIARQVDRLVSLKIMAETPLVPKEPSRAKPVAKPKDKP